MENAYCALTAAAEHGPAYGADPQQAIWTVFSAGAWLGSLISFSPGDLQSMQDAFTIYGDETPQRVLCTSELDPAHITAYLPTGGVYPGEFWLLLGGYGLVFGHVRNPFGLAC